MGRLIFNQPYDNPYRILALHLASTLSLHSLKRVMHDTNFIRSLVLSETRQVDLSGPFLDCVDQEIISNDNVRMKNAALKSLGEFYYSNLDVPRLREELRKFVVDECGIDIKE